MGTARVNPTYLLPTATEWTRLLRSVSDLSCLLFPAQPTPAASSRVLYCTFCPGPLGPFTRVPSLVAPPPSCRRPELTASQNRPNPRRQSEKARAKRH